MSVYTKTQGVMVVKYKIIGDAGCISPTIWRNEVG